MAGESFEARSGQSIEFPPLALHVNWGGASKG